MQASTLTETMYPRDRMPAMTVNVPVTRLCFYSVFKGRPATFCKGESHRYFSLAAFMQIQVKYNYYVVIIFIAMIAVI